MLLITLVLSLLSFSKGAESSLPQPALTSPIEQWCKELSRDLRSVNYERCMKRDWKSDATTQGGHPIPYVYWGSEDPNAQRIFVLGAIHGDEISAVSTVFRWMDFLDRTKPDSFLRNKKYLFFPLVNPDGYHSKPRTRTNLSGVDLNRNFSTKSWDEKALKYWKERAKSNKRRYPGPSAASEIETRVVEKAITEFKPDLIISVHAPYTLVDHDGPIIFPNIKSPLPVRTLGAYPGSLGSYGGIERNIPVVTPELPSPTTLPNLKALEDLFIFIMKSKY